jgi:hypothetical protein
MDQLSSSLRRILAAIRDKALCAPCLVREVMIATEPEIRETIANAPVQYAIRGAERICANCNIIRLTYLYRTPKAPKPTTAPAPAARPNSVIR